MPPKKVDPQVHRKQYQAYKQTEEWKKIAQINSIMRNQLHRISQTSKDYDLNGRFQMLWDSLYQLAVMMKIKPPFKKIQHEWIRSIYFGEKKKTDAKDVPYYLDGVLCEFQPIEADPQHNLRQALIKKVYNYIDDLDMNFDIDSYLKSRSQLKKGFIQFFNLMKVYVKKTFKIIYQGKLLILMQPFTDLLEINMKLVLHQLKYTTKQELFVNNFKYKAIVDRYCTCLDHVQQILSTHHHKPVKVSIKPHNIFKKLDYQNLSKIQIFYLTPYKQAFSKMKQGLCALFTTGVNFWKVPLEQNKYFVDDFCAIINWQLIVQRLFGNQLLRDQINFVASTLSNVVKANGLAEKYLIKQDLNCMQITIPRLVAFKTILHMRKFKDKQLQILKKQQLHDKLLGIGDKSNLKVDQDVKSVNNSEIMPNNTITTQNKSMFKVTEMEGKKQINKQTKNVSQELKNVDPLQQELQKMGRYWLWDNYCDEQFKNDLIQSAVENLRHINKAIYQDIQDTIIRDGMLPRRQRQNQELKSAAETLKQMKTMDNSLKSENMRRPPELWNYPKIIEEQHKFRSIADPKKCYIDGRIEELDEQIIAIGQHLRRHAKKYWNQLIRRVIDFFAGEPDPNSLFKFDEQQKSQQEQSIQI